MIGVKPWYLWTTKYPSYRWQLWARTWTWRVSSMVSVCNHSQKSRMQCSPLKQKGLGHPPFRPPPGWWFWIRTSACLTSLKALRCWQPGLSLRTLPLSLGVWRTEVMESWRLSSISHCSLLLRALAMRWRTASTRSPPRHHSPARNPHPSKLLESRLELWVKYNRSSLAMFVINTWLMARCSPLRELGLNEGGPQNWLFVLIECEHGVRELPSCHCADPYRNEYQIQRPPGLGNQYCHHFVESKLFETRISVQTHLRVHCITHPPCFLVRERPWLGYATHRHFFLLNLVLVAKTRLPHVKGH